MNFKKIVEKEPILEDKGFLEIEDPLLKRLLILRGIKDDREAKDFLNPKGTELSTAEVFSDAKKAADRVKCAILNGEKILIWGDFDADGVTSSALMHKTLSALGANFEIFIPNRQEHGHGLNSKELLKRVAKDKIKVVITVDCGISNVAEVKLLNGFKVDTIITDHHKVEGEIPKAYAILNPQAPDSLKSDLNVGKIKDLSALAGVGVAYKFALELLGKDEKYKDLKDELLILATVGTISDVVPLLGENRAIVTRGLELINENKHLGIKMLFEFAGRKDKITSTDIAFALTPKINATGRLSTPDLAFDFLVENNASSLNFIIEKLDNFNKIRQSLCDETYKEAVSIINSDKNYKKEPAVVIINENWHLGIVGIVASKLVETYLKPAFVMTVADGNMARCSIRSYGDYNVYEILKRNAQYFEGFGGHALAGGFSFNLEKYSFEKVKEAILATVEELKPDIAVENVFKADKFLNPTEINQNLLETIEKLEPTGQDNPAPVFAIKDATLINSRTMGKNNNHLKFTIEKDGYNFECVKWSEENLPICANSKIDVAFSPALNDFMGSQTIQLFVEDVYSENLQIKGAQNSDFKVYDHRKKTGILAQIAQYLKDETLDIGVWAKKAKTLSILKDYPDISNRIVKDKKTYNSIMFFDYPINSETFENEIKTIQPNKVHFMKVDMDYDIESYVKAVCGMLKYSFHHKNGEIDIEKMAQAIGASESFIQIVLEIFEATGAIEILDIDKINYIKTPDLNAAKSHAMYEVLTSELEKINEFKKYLAESDIGKIKDEIKSLLNT